MLEINNSTLFNFFIENIPEEIFKYEAFLFLNIVRHMNWKHTKKHNTYTKLTRSLKIKYSVRKHVSI